MGWRPRTRRSCRWVPLLALVGAVVLGACATSDAPDGDAREQRYPDVLAAELQATNGTWQLSATLSSPYDTPERYADAFRALDEDGNVLGVRELAHDHANEQPFTRSLSGLAIPEDVERITVEGRDQRYGWGGATVEVEVPAGADGGG
ncbi:MAG: hypothetical protein ACNA8R_07880 [Nitriliruptoraceae bacterium]